MQRLRGIFMGGACVATLFLAGCAAPLTPSVPINTETAGKGISLSRSLPAVLPDKAVPIPHSQFVLIPGESAAGLLMPIPFVSEAIGGAMDRSNAAAFEARYASIAPYKVALAEMEKSPLFKATDGALTLQPFVFMTECVDDKYRLALVFQIHGGDWVGRYMVHLPTVYAVADFKSPSPAVLETLKQELTAGAQVLRQLVERGARGELRTNGAKADVGSLHLVGGKAAGLVSPTLLVGRGADLIEDSADHVIVRMAGDMSHAGTVGGLFFGVHYLRKDQLHTFKKL